MEGAARGLSEDLMTLFQQTGRVPSDVTRLAYSAKLSTRDLVSVSLSLAKDPRLVSLFAQMPRATIEPAGGARQIRPLPASPPSPVDLVGLYPQWIARLRNDFGIDEDEIWDLHVAAPGADMTLADVVAMEPAEGRAAAAVAHVFGPVVRAHLPPHRLVEQSGPSRRWHRRRRRHGPAVRSGGGVCCRVEGG